MTTTKAISTNDLCAKLGLTGMDKIVCETMAKEPLTANMLYQLVTMIEPKIPILTHGIEDIIKNNATRIVMHNVLLQQVPWLLSFFLIILTLVLTDTISVATFIILFISAILIAIMTVGLYLYLNEYSLEKMVKEVKLQMKANVAKFKKIK